MYLNGKPFIKVNYQKSSGTYHHLIGLDTSDEIANKTSKYKYDILPFCKPTEFFCKRQWWEYILDSLK